MTEELSTPAAVESEAAYLGCLLLGAPAALAVLPLLEVEDFAMPVHQTVLIAARALLARDEPVDAMTVLGELRRSGQAASRLDDNRIGVVLANLTERVPIPAAGRSYAIDVLDAALRRRIAEMGGRLLRLSESHNLDSLVRLTGTEAVAVRALVERRQQVCGPASSRGVAA